MFCSSFYPNFVVDVISWQQDTVSSKSVCVITDQSRLQLINYHNLEETDKPETQLKQKKSYFDQLKKL